MERSEHGETHFALCCCNFFAVAVVDGDALGQQNAAGEMMCWAGNDEQKDNMVSQCFQDRRRRRHPLEISACLQADPCYVADFAIPAEW